MGVLQVREQDFVVRQDSSEKVELVVGACVFLLKILNIPILYQPSLLVGLYWISNNAWLNNFLHRLML
jgi:hypothetical protein